MNTRLIKKDHYNYNDLTGIAKRCDWFINGQQLLSKDIQNPKTIFITGLRGYYGIVFFVRKLLPNINSNFKLIIASEDYTFPTGKGDMRYNMYGNCQYEIGVLLESKFLDHIFVENLDITHEKMTPIPLGILYISNIDNPEFRKNYNKEVLCLSLHRTRDGLGQWKDRKRSDDLCSTKWKNFVKLIKDELNYGDFVEEIKKSKFCLCIHGGGYDPCPKFFECILYGTIPIIQHSPLDSVYERFPCVYIGDLNEDSLSEEFLNSEFNRLKDFYSGEKREKILNMLTLDYWWKIINNLPT